MSRNHWMLVDDNSWCCTGSCYGIEHASLTIDQGHQTTISNTFRLIVLWFLNTDVNVIAGQKHHGPRQDTSCQEQNKRIMELDR